MAFEPLPLHDALFDAPSLDLVLGYWRSKSVDGGVPERKSIEPYEIPEALQDLYLMNVRDDAENFQYRLVGTRIERVIGLSVTGLWLDEVQPASILDLLLPLYRKAATGGRPVYSEGRFLADGRMRLLARRLYAPLMTDGDRVGQLLCVQDLDFANDADSGEYRELLAAVRDGLLNYEQSQYVLS